MRLWLPAIHAGSGSDVFTIRLADALRARGVHATVTWFRRPYELFPRLMGFTAMPRGTDVIHANGWLAFPFLEKGVPVVTTIHHLVHDPAYADYRSVLQSAYHNIHIRRRERLAIQRSAEVTSVSAYVANTVQAFSGRRPIVIPNWVDTSLYRPGEVQAVRSSSFRLLMVGNQSRRKGVDLIPSFSRALGEGVELRCTGGLRGGRDDRSPGVRWLGTLTEPELIREYQQCDLVVSLSRYEGFGYSALEAMACGKPFLGFDTSGLSEVVRSGITGLLVPIEDVKALAAACHALASEPLRLAEMGYAARAYTLEAFSPQRSIDQYIKLYAGLC